MPTPVRQRLEDWSTKEMWVISANGFFLYSRHLDVQKQAINIKTKDLGTRSTSVGIQISRLRVS